MAFIYNFGGAPTGGGPGAMAPRPPKSGRGPSQTPAEAASPRKRGYCVTWSVCLAPSLRWYHLYCLVNRGTRVWTTCQGLYVKRSGRDSNLRPLDCRSDALTTTPPRHTVHCMLKKCAPENYNFSQIINSLLRNFQDYSQALCELLLRIKKNKYNSANLCWNNKKRIIKYNFCLSISR